MVYIGSPQEPSSPQIRREALPPLEDKADHIGQKALASLKTSPSRTVSASIKPLTGLAKVKARIYDLFMKVFASKKVGQAKDLLAKEQWDVTHFEEARRLAPFFPRLRRHELLQKERDFVASSPLPAQVAAKPLPSLTAYDLACEAIKQDRFDEAKTVLGQDFSGIKEEHSGLRILVGWHLVKTGEVDQGVALLKTAPLLNVDKEMLLPYVVPEEAAVLFGVTSQPCSHKDLGLALYCKVPPSDRLPDFLKQSNDQSLGLVLPAMIRDMMMKGKPLTPTDGAVVFAEAVRLSEHDRIPFFEKIATRSFEQESDRRQVLNALAEAYIRRGYLPKAADLILAHNLNMEPAALREVVEGVDPERGMKLYERLMPEDQTADLAFGFAHAAFERRDLEGARQWLQKSGSLISKAVCKTLADAFLAVNQREKAALVLSLLPRAFASELERLLTGDFSFAGLTGDELLRLQGINSAFSERVAHQMVRLGDYRGFVQLGREKLAHGDSQGLRDLHVIVNNTLLVPEDRQAAALALIQHHLLHDHTDDARQIADQAPFPSLAHAVISEHLRKIGAVGRSR